MRLRSLLIASSLLMFAAAPLAFARGKSVMVTPGGKKPAAKGKDDKGAVAGEVLMDIAGRAKIVKVPDLAKFELEDRSVVDASTEGREGVVLNPLKVGETFLVVTKKDGKRVRYKVKVESASASAKAAVSPDAGSR